MPSKKPNSRLNEFEAQKRSEERQSQRTRRWQRIIFFVISVIVLLSMVITLFIHP